MDLNKLEFFKIMYLLKMYGGSTYQFCKYNIINKNQYNNCMICHKVINTDNNFKFSIQIISITIRETPR